MKSASIVLGLQFGDEGKGRTVDYLCAKHRNSLVVRFSGGQQAGHTVVRNGVRHVFSSFGSGTLLGVPTFISRFCTFNILNIVNEYEVLKDKLTNDDVFLLIDPLAMLTTPYDVAYNKTTELLHNGHGSCGLGVGATMNRNLNTPYKLFAIDLAHPVFLKQKLEKIKSYYTTKFTHLQDLNTFLHYLSQYEEDYLKAIEKLPPYISIRKPHNYEFDHVIFEGSQGILLDMDHGIFPNVTYSNTTSKNAITLCKEFDIDLRDVTTYYVTRTYKTRHGEGWMGEEYKDVPPEIIDKTNVYNEWQKDLRVGPFDQDLIEHAFQIDRIYNDTNSVLVMTCADQVRAPKIKKSVLIEIFLKNTIIFNDEENKPVKYNTVY